MRRHRHEPPNLVPFANFLRYGEVLVCGTDHPDFPRVYKCRCKECARPIMCSNCFEYIPTKLCVGCSPIYQKNLKENDREYTEGSKGAT